MDCKNHALLVILITQGDLQVMSLHSLTAGGKYNNSKNKQTQHQEQVWVQYITQGPFNM